MPPRQREWHYKRFDVAWTSANAGAVQAVPVATLAPGETIGHVIVRAYLVVVLQSNTLPPVTDGCWWGCRIRVTGFDTDPLHPETDPDAWMLWEWQQATQLNRIARISEQFITTTNASSEIRVETRGQRTNKAGTPEDFGIVARTPNFVSDAVNIFLTGTVRALRYSGPPI